MAFPQRLLARSVVLILLVSLLPAFQPPAAEAQGTATYNLTKYDCAPGYDPGSGDPGAAFANCVTPASGVQFTLSSGDASYGGGSQSTDGGGFTGWAGIPTGVGYAVSESIPSGYGTPWVYCEVSGDPNNPSDVQTSFFQAPGGNMDVGYSDPSLTSYTQANCTWFNIVPNDGSAELQVEGGENQPPPGATTVTIQKQLCGFQYRHDYLSASLADLQANCPGPQSDVGFMIGGDPATLTYPDGNGIVAFANIPVGNVVIQEEIYTGADTARVFCRPHAAADTSITYADADEVAVQDGGNDAFSVSVSVTDGNKIDCLWYNVLLTESDRASVIISKYSCPDGTEVPSGNLDEEIDDVCVNPVAGPAFEFLSGSSSITVPGDASGTTAALNLVPGAWSITQTQPAGYTTGRVFCHGTNIGGGQAEMAAYTEYPVTNSNQIQIELQAGYEYICYWIDTTSTSPTTDETGTVHVYKYNCPEGFDWETGGYDDLVSGCTDPGSGVGFQLRTLNYQHDETTDSDGAATWDDAPFGSITLYEQVPSGFKIGRIFCGESADSATEPSSWEEVSYAGGLDLEIVAGQVLTCTVFDVPIGYGTVVVYKYDCPADFDWQSGAYHELIAGCATPHEGVTFEATSHSPNTYSQEQSTDSAGIATWTDVPEGGISIQEQEPSGFALVRVFCGTSQQNSGTLPSTWEEYQHTPEIDTTVPAGEYLHCAFFDLPDDNGDTGDGYPITITKYTCEHFLTRGPAGRADFEEHCTEWAEGVEFTLYAGMEVVDTATTDASGVAILDAPATGQYQIVETPVDGYLTGAVYCMTSATDDPTQPETLPLTIDVTADYPVTCTWYNGEDVWGDLLQDPGAILVHKYNCPPGYPSDGTTGFEELREGCSIPAPNVDFSVDQGGSQVASGTTDSQGEVALTGAGIGATRISEPSIDGWDPPRVFCASVPVGIGRTLVEYQEQTVTTWGIDYDIPEDSWLDCYWFNRPPNEGTDGQPIQIIIHKIVCDPGIDEPGDTYAGASTECVTPEEGVNFDLIGGDGGTSGGPTDANGYAEYNGVAPGEVTITETPREGYGTGRVFCSFSSGTTVTDYLLVPVENEAIQAYVAPGYKLECYWYNIVEPEVGHVYVFKYTCPEGTSSTALDDLAVNCTEKQAGVTFTLTNPAVADPLTVETDSSGLAAWYDVLAGDWTLTETAPAGYEAYAVYCGESDTAYIPPAIVEPETLNATDSSVEIEVHHDTYTMCYWYNIEAHDDPQVWLYKYNCPDDADWHWNYHQLLSHCTAPAPGVEFGYGPEGERSVGFDYRRPGPLALRRPDTRHLVLGRALPDRILRRGRLLPVGRSARLGRIPEGRARRRHALAGARLRSGRHVLLVRFPGRPRSAVTDARFRIGQLWRIGWQWQLRWLRQRQWRRHDPAPADIEHSDRTSRRRSTRRHDQPAIRSGRSRHADHHQVHLPRRLRPLRRRIRCRSGLRRTDRRHRVRPHRSHRARRSPGKRGSSPRHSAHGCRWRGNLVRSRGRALSARGIDAGRYRGSLHLDL